MSFPGLARLDEAMEERGRSHCGMILLGSREYGKCVVVVLEAVNDKGVLSACRLMVRSPPAY